MIVKDVSNLLTEKSLLKVVSAGRTWISRNSKCVCGSQKRFKRCCMEIKK